MYVRFDENARIAASFPTLAAAVRALGAAALELRVHTVSPILADAGEWECRELFRWELEEIGALLVAR